MQMPTVTVLIAAYNAAPFLHRAIHSALTQTQPPFEILIVDDASTDDTLAVAQTLIEADPRIRVISLSENGGPAKARNAGLDEARGDWIAILDADDAFLPDRLERLIDIGNDMKVEVVVDNFLWYDAKTNTIGEPGISTSPAVEMIDIYRFVSKAMPFTNEMDWGLLKPVFRRNFLDDYNLRYPALSRHGEDFLLTLDIFLAGACFAVSHTPGYLYTHRSSGFSRTKIDYDGMAAHTASLLTHDRIRSDEYLVRLLRKRMYALRRLSAEYKLCHSLDNRNFEEIFRAMPFDPNYCQAVFRFGWRRIKKQIKIKIKTAS